MFRVLSDEEADKVKRWKAPTLPGTAANIASTHDWAKPVAVIDSNTLSKGESEKVSLSSATNEVHTSAPELLVAQHLDSTSAGIGSFSKPSIDSLQASYDEGYAKGFAEGNVALHLESVKQLQAVIHAIENTQPTGNSDENVQNEVMGLATDIAKLLLRREISMDPEHLTSLVQLGIQQLPSSVDKDITVYLHPIDARVVKEAMLPSSAVCIAEDVSLKRAQCRIEEGMSTVHSGVDEWIAAVERELGIFRAEENGS